MAYDTIYTPGRRLASTHLERKRLVDLVFPAKGKEPKFPNAVGRARQWLFDVLPATSKSLAFNWSDETAMSVYNEMISGRTSSKKFARNPLYSFSLPSLPLQMASRSEHTEKGLTEQMKIEQSLVDHGILPRKHEKRIA